MTQQAATLAIPYLDAPSRLVTYDNGFTFVHVPKRGDVFNISTWVRTGSIHEDDRVNGVSHFLEHLLFKGTERFKPGEFDKAMESMGAIINAATWKDFTFYYITGPRGKSEENFDLALDMHADMMLHSTLPEAEVGPPYDPADANYSGEKRERSVVIEEISMREDQPWTKIYNSLNHMMYADGHPYRRDVIGTRQIIGTIPRTDILDYYQTWYTPANFTTIVVGDFETEALEAKILQHFRFTGTTRTASIALPDGSAGHPDAKRFEQVRGDYQTVFFMLGFHGPNPSDLEATIALDVISHVLGESRSSRLTQALLEKPAHPVFNFVSCGQSTFKLGNVFFIQGNFNQNNPEETQPGETINGIPAQLHREVEKLLTTAPITEEELRRAVKKLKVDFAETSETAAGIAETIGESLTVTGSLDHYLHYLSALEKLDAATVNRVARRYLTLDKAYTSVLVPEQGTEA